MFDANYRSACSTAGVAPRIPTGASGTVLSANGNSDALRKDRLKDADIAPLVSALLSGHTFEELDLSYNRLATGAAESLKTLLESDAQLRVLNLAENEIGEAAAQMLCAALKENGTLEILSLSGNKLGGPGGLAVADLLQQPGSGLKHLNLANCELTTESLVALATVLQVNDKVLSLSVARSLNAPLMEEATSHFSRMLKVNSTLMELDLSRCAMRDFGLQLLTEELCRAGEESRLSTLILKGARRLQGWGGIGGGRRGEECGRVVWGSVGQSWVGSDSGWQSLRTLLYVFFCFSAPSSQSVRVG